jgi:hypothetical protein
MSQEEWFVDGPRVIDVGLIRRLKVGLVAGQVDIVGHNEPGARIEVHSVSGRDLRVSVDGDVLEIDHPQLRWDNFLDVFRDFANHKNGAKADVSIMVPHEVALKFGVVSASALVTGLTGEANISTVTGDVVVDRHIGALHLNAVSGEVSVRDHLGDISAHTISGDVTASGEIDTFACDGVSADVYLDVTGAPTGIRVNSVSGDVTARLAPEVAAEYTVNTVTGRMQLDDSQITGVRGAYTGHYGVLEGSWLRLSANTVSGNVSVLHAVRA